MSNPKKIVSLIVSHNNRLQCLFDKIIFHFTGRNNSEKIRFQNCAILRVSIDATDSINTPTFSARLVYSGSLSDSEKRSMSANRRYYISDDDTKNTGNFYQKMEPIIKHLKEAESNHFLNEFKLNFPEYLKNANTEYVFYIVRHGVSEHNEKILPGIKSTLGLKLDTSLVERGVDQTVLAAKNLVDILIKNHDVINFLFASDLKRTRQTIFKIVAELVNFQIRNKGSVIIDLTKLPRVIVLPCASELSTSGSGIGDCDTVTASTNVLSKISRENYPDCTLTDISNPKDSKMCYKIGNVLFDWKYYLLFYGNAMRGQNDTIYGTVTGRRTRSTRQLCRNTNILSIAIFIINNRNNPNMENELNLYMLNLKNKLILQNNVTPSETVASRLKIAFPLTPSIAPKYGYNPLDEYNSSFTSAAQEGNVGVGKMPNPAEEQKFVLMPNKPPVRDLNEIVKRQGLEDRADVVAIREIRRRNEENSRQRRIREQFDNPKGKSVTQKMSTGGRKKHNSNKRHIKKNKTQKKINRGTRKIKNKK